MKRPLPDDPAEGGAELRKRRVEDAAAEMADSGGTATGFSDLDGDLLFEVLKHVDARTLGTAACVCRLWCRTAKDERLWEMICTRQSASLGCGSQHFRSVVLALGGFRRLHALYLWPLLTPPAAPRPDLPPPPPSRPSSASSPVSILSPLLSFPRGMKTPKNPPKHWGKDEVNLSLSLLSIGYYEKLNLSKRQMSSD